MSSHITLRQFRTFIAVAESGSVAGASRMLAIAQSAVTRSMQALEAELGQRLLERSARGVALTPAGPGAGLAGTLAVGVTSLVAGYSLSKLLMRFTRNCPAVRVLVTEETPPFVEHLLINGELDMAIMLSNALAEPQALVAQTLTRSPNRV